MGGCWTPISHDEVLRPPDKKRCRRYSEGKLHSKGGAESEPGSSVVTGWMAVPSVEGEGGSDEFTWGAVTCVLSVGPLSGVPICSWLFPCVLVILHSFPLRSALCLSPPCAGRPKAGLRALWPPIWAQLGRPCRKCSFPPGQPWFGQHLFPTSARPLELWSSCALG